MEMRLGKTRVSIAWANAHGCRRNLVVCPVTVIGSWQDELKIVGEPAPYIMRDPERLHASAQYKWNLTNFEFVRLHPNISTMDWDAVIVDESTRIKDPKSQVGRALIGGTAKRKVRGTEEYERVAFPGCHAPHRAILSGLPAPEGPLNYFCQFQFLHGGMLNCRGYYMFRDHFFAPGPMGWDYEPTSRGRFMIKQYLHENAFVLSRKQAGLKNHKVYETRRVELPPALRRAYNKVEKEYIAEYEGRHLGDTQWAMVASTWLARMAGGFLPVQPTVDLNEDITDSPGEFVSDAKVKELVALVMTELKDQQIIVWYRFNAEIEESISALRKVGIDAAAIMGVTPYATRDQFRRMFAKGEIRIILCQIKCARYGIDLSAADTAIYFSNSYALEERAQSEDRIVHPLKTTPLLYIDLVAANTVDEAVVETLREKHADARYFLSKLIERFRGRR